MAQPVSHLTDGLDRSVPLGIVSLDERHFNESSDSPLTCIIKADVVNIYSRYSRDGFHFWLNYLLHCVESGTRAVLHSLSCGILVYPSFHSTIER